MKILIFALTAILIAQCKNKNPCVWTDPQGNEFDLSKLQKKPQWEVRDDLTGMGIIYMNYIFNFCNFDGITCSGEQVSAYETIEIGGEKTDTCDIISRSTIPDISHIDNKIEKGLKIQYSKGDECFDVFDINTISESKSIANEKQLRKSIFYITCDANDGDTFTVDTSSACETIFKINHHVGCKGGGAASSTYKYFKMLVIILIIIGCYFVLGYYYNKKQMGLEGFEALPHSNFWKDFPQLVVEGLRFTTVKIAAIIRFIKEKIQNKEPESKSYIIV